MILNSECLPSKEGDFADAQTLGTQVKKLVESAQDPLWEATEAQLELLQKLDSDSFDDIEDATDRLCASMKSLLTLQDEYFVVQIHFESIFLPFFQQLRHSVAANDCWPLCSPPQLMLRGHLTTEELGVRARGFVVRFKAQETFQAMHDTALDLERAWARQQGSTGAPSTNTHRLHPALISVPERYALDEDFQEAAKIPAASRQPACARPSTA